MMDKKTYDIVDEMMLEGEQIQTLAYDKVIRNAEMKLIQKALKRTFGNQSIAAKVLGINRNTLRSKINKLGIDVKIYKI